jgi:hypothetical protein
VNTSATAAASSILVSSNNDESTTDVDIGNDDASLVNPLERSVPINGVKPNDADEDDDVVRVGDDGAGITDCRRRASNSVVNDASRASNS